MARPPKPSTIQKRLIALDKQRAALLQQYDRQPDTTGPAPPKQNLWMVIRDYLRFEPHGTTTRDHLVQMLLDAGHDLGSKPTRTVSACITSKYTRDVIFRTWVEDGAIMVMLLGSGDVRYMPTPSRAEVFRAHHPRTQAKKGVPAAH